MSNTVLYTATSLDGYVAGKHDDISWLDPFESVDYKYEEFFAGLGATITGRRTYDLGVEKGWKWPYPVPSFILSPDTPEQTESGADLRFVSGELQDILRQAQEAAGDKNVWVTGGAHVAQSFLQKNLIDRIILTVVPVMLDDGIRLFENNGSHKLSLKEVQQFDKGLVQLTYSLNG